MAGRGHRRPDPTEPVPELRPIPSTFGRYLAGADGSIWRAPGFDASGMWRQLHRCTPRDNGGWGARARRGKYVRVNTLVMGVLVDRPVHRLVAEAWLPDYHPLLVGHHVNHDSLDNRPENLRCMTRAEHERLHGLYVTDADITNARYDFELHRDDPVPSPYTAARRESQREAARARQSATGKRARAINRLDRLIGECFELDENRYDDEGEGKDG